MKVKSLLTLVVATILWIPTETQGEPRFVAQTIHSDIQIGSTAQSLEGARFFAIGASSIRGQ